MLSRKTLGVAGAAILGSMALLATNTASAVINIDTGTGVKVAKETLLDSAVTTPTGTTTKYYNLVESSTPGGEFDIVMKQGIALGAGATLYLRVELMNMLFNSGSPLTAGSSNGNVNLALTSGGGAGESSVVFSLPGHASSAIADVLTIDVPAITVLPNAAGSVKATLHRDSLEAALGANPVLTVMADGVVQVVDGLEERGTSSDAMSDVASGFAMFDGDDPTSAQIGSLRIKAADNVLHRDGTVAVRGPGSFVEADATATDEITATFKGDFSNHTFTVHAAEDCDTATNAIAAAGTGNTSGRTAALNKAKDELTVELNNADGVTTDAAVSPQTKMVVMLSLCVEVGEKNTVPIPDTDYMATV